MFVILYGIRVFVIEFHKETKDIFLWYIGRTSTPKSDIWHIKYLMKYLNMYLFSQPISYTIT